MEAPFTLDDVLKGTSGIYLRGDAGRFRSVSTDTRTIRKGDLFWALRGESHDGHSFVAEAVRKGAVGAVVEKRSPPAQDVLRGKRTTVVAVDDTTRALGDMAGYWRRRLSPRVVAITGSNGKTGTKDMTVAALARSFSVLGTEGNLNNLIGVPLTLLRLRDEDAAVVEMGMNAPGEIRRLAEIARPDVAVITNVAPAHLEKLGDIEGVARAKAELFEGLGPGAIACVNAADPRIVAHARRLRGVRKVRFGIAGEARGALDVSASRVESRGIEGSLFELRFRGKDPVPVKIQPLGLHQVRNAVAAAVAGFALDREPEEVAEGLAAYRGFHLRMEVHRLRGGTLLVNDSYNANPVSMRLALETAASLAAPGVHRVAALGEMRELGDASPELHRGVGEVAARLGFDGLFALGGEAAATVAGAHRAGMRGSRARGYGDVKPLVQDLVTLLRSGPAVVLVKGSRLARMERVAEELIHRLGVEEGA